MTRTDETDWRIWSNVAGSPTSAMASMMSTAHEARKPRLADLSAKTVRFSAYSSPPCHLSDYKHLDGCSSTIVAARGANTGDLSGLGAGVVEIAELAFAGV